MKPCRVLLWLFGILWVLAFGLFLVGQFGLFGQERDPLAGVFLMPLGLPWNVFIPEGPASAVLAILAPGVNLFLIALLCRRLRGKTGQS